MIRLFHMIALCLTCVVMGNTQMAVWHTKQSGTIDSVHFELKNIDSTENELYILKEDEENYFYHPLDDKKVVAFAGSDNWHLTFDKQVKNLCIHIGVWRPGIYKFSEPFHLRSHSKNMKQIDDYYLLIERSNYEPKGNFGRGCIVFSQPICCLFVESSRTDRSPQLMTFDLRLIFSCRNVILKEIKDIEEEQLKACKEKAFYYPKRILD